MKKSLFLIGIVLFGCVACGAFRPVQTPSANSFAAAGSGFNAGGYYHDTIKVKQDSLNKNQKINQQDSLNKNQKSNQQDSLNKDQKSNQKGNLRDTLIDSTLKYFALKDSSAIDSLADSTLRDSLLRDSILRDSLIRDSLIRDSLVRDSLIRDSIEMAALREATRYDFSPVLQADVYVPSSQAIPAGQYSGITYIGDNRYAVVHDKLNGGGIVFFNIVLDDKGKVRSASATVPSFTSNSKVTGRDNEGVAFVKSSAHPANASATASATASANASTNTSGNASATASTTASTNTSGNASGNASGTLFISSESQQTIVEYTLDGKETGRSLKIPAAFAKDKINSNNGFEALTYNALTKTFWTTTETPLKADGKESRLLRLQSFGSDLKAKKQYLYKMDAPAKSAAEGAAAKAYVHGVPALVALDDGSLIVLEREVYVPNGGLFAKALGSFTRTKLYVVTPEPTSASTSVQKSSISSASTSTQKSSSSSASTSVQKSSISSASAPTQKSSSSSATTSVQKSSSATQKNSAGSNVLEKSLMLQFTTASLNLANFEGMCLGPDLPGGWHTLILIADSQGGSNGLTAEYIKVLLFK